MLIVFMAIVGLGVDTNSKAVIYIDPRLDAMCNMCRDVRYTRMSARHDEWCLVHRMLYTTHTHMNGVYVIVDFVCLNYNLSRVNARASKRSAIKSIKSSNETDVVCEGGHQNTRVIRIYVYKKHHQGDLMYIRVYTIDVCAVSET